MAEHRPMDAVEFREVVDIVGFSTSTLADRLGIAVRVVARWASGYFDVPPEVANWLRSLANWHKLNPLPEGWVREDDVEHY